MNQRYPGIPKPVDLTGCSFQGQQLSAHELQERELRSKAMEEHRKTVDKKVILIRKHVKATGNEPETRKVSVRGRYFSSNEIRKEYGIMAKPYESHTLNVLWCIINKGPVDIRAIADEMEYDDYKVASRHFSGAVSNLWRCLGTDPPWGCGWMKREMDGRRWHYAIVGEVRSVEVMHAKYLEINKSIWQEKREKARKKNLLNPVMDPNTEKAPDPEATIENEARKAQEEVSPGRQGTQPINRTIEQYLERLIGLTVEVNGTIDINVNFGFRRENEPESI